MEYVSGQTLGARIGEAPLPVSEVLDIASQIADALDAHGITHRDIKPGNIMVTSCGQINERINRASL
jgi:serine/threonine-protein kinase